MKRLWGFLCLMAAVLPAMAQTVDTFDAASMTNWDLVYGPKGQGVVTDGKMSIVNLSYDDWICVFRKTDTSTTTDFEVGVTAEPTAAETQTFGLIYNYERGSGNFDAFVLKNNKAAIIFFREGRPVESYETFILGKELRKGIRLSFRSSSNGIKFSVNDEVAFVLHYKPITHKGVGLIVGPGNTLVTVKFDDFYQK